MQANAAHRDGPKEVAAWLFPLWSALEAVPDRWLLEALIDAAMEAAYRGGLSDDRYRRIRAIVAEVK